MNRRSRAVAHALAMGDMSVAARLGHAMRAARVAAGLTQSAAAEKSGAALTQSLISAIEHGARLPRLATLVALSDLYGVTLDSICKQANINGRDGDG